MEQTYVENGQAIFETFCSPLEPTPTMLPRAPDQTYVDMYPKEDEPGCIFANERKHQTDYEAEVMVYRAKRKPRRPS